MNNFKGILFGNISRHDNSVQNYRGYFCSICLIIVLISTSSTAIGAGRVYPKATVSVGKVFKTADIVSHRYTGQIVAKARVQIVPRISGEIMEIGFKDGTIVKKGQLLYKLEDTQYKAAVKSAEAKVLESEARFEYAKNDYNRSSQLYKKNAVSRDEMENDKAECMAYKAMLLKAEALLITAKDELTDTAIIAPIEGLVGVTKYTVGNYITPSSGVLITIIQLQPVRVRFSISTADVLSMFGDVKNLRKEGMVTLKLSDGSSYPKEGNLELANNEANSTTDTIQLFANFPNNDYRLIIGSTVEVILAKKSNNEIPAVLPSAIMHDNKGAYVYLVDKNNKVKQQYVTLGVARSTYQTISSGVKVGETVITKGTHKTIPGAEIIPVLEK